MSSRQQSWKKLLKLVVKLLNRLGIKLLNFFMQLLRNIQPFVQYLRKRISVVFALILLILFGSTALVTLIPSQHKFEGHLLVQELSFTTNQPNQLFLNSIRGITQLVCQGKQTISLTGSFQSNTEPKFNQVNSLDIELYSPNSHLIIAPANPEVSSEIELIELRLQEPTNITSLIYNAFGNRLALSLQPINFQPQNTTSNSLQLYLGEQPLKIILEGYRLPKLVLQDSSDAPNSLELTFSPDIKDLKLALGELTNLSINLPNPERVDSTQWLWGNLSVQDINFTTVQRTGVDATDELDTSTILKGTIRMSEKELPIEPNQFLMIDDPGIQKLRHLQIKHPEGFEVRFAGKTKLVQVALDPDFPISKIQSSVLNRVFSNELVIAIISFCSAMVAALLSWLVENFFKTS